MPKSAHCLLFKRGGGVHYRILPPHARYPNKGLLKTGTFQGTFGRRGDAPLHMSKNVNTDNVLAGHPAVEALLAQPNRNSPKTGYGTVQGSVKRVFDVICASIGLIVLSPLFLVVAIIIKLDSKGPVFFRHERVGQHEKLFRIHKFRSMVVEQEESDLHITPTNDPRITRTGRFLRKWKIDELPQLIDVWCGQMSLVGPRPSNIKYVSKYPKPIKEIVFSVKPGITDLSSIQFCDEGNLLAKSETHPEEIFFREILPKKLRLQMEYVKKQSLWLDVKIIVKTINVIFFK